MSNHRFAINLIVVFFTTSVIAVGSFDNRKDSVRVSNLHHVTNQVAVEPLQITQVINGTFSVGQIDTKNTTSFNNNSRPKQKGKLAKREKKKLMTTNSPVHGKNQFSSRLQN